MKVFRELTIHGDKPSIAKLLEEISSSLKNGWARNRDQESLVDSLGPDRKMVCFACTQENARPAAYLWIAADNSTARVSNIVPKDRTRLTVDEYNDILAEFYGTYAQPALTQLELRVDFTDADQTLEHWAPKDVAAKLRFFSKTANKSNPIHG